MLPRRLGGVAGRREQLAGAKERRRRTSRNVVAEEGQGVDGDRATDRDEGSTDSRYLLAMRRVLCDDVCMHLRSSELKAMGLLHGNSLGCLLGCHCCELRVGYCSRPRETCWWWKRGRRDGLLKLLFEFPSTDVDDAYRTLVEANRTTRISTTKLVASQLHVQEYFHRCEGSRRLL
jgi:hypothetical protein